MGQRRERRARVGATAVAIGEREHLGPVVVDVLVAEERLGVRADRSDLVARVDTEREGQR